MNERPDIAPLDGLPPELAELDRELAGLTMAERPSFGPELEAELGREWLSRARWRSGRGMWRGAVAASVAAVVFAAMAVPPARASLVTRLQQILEVFQEVEAAAVRPELRRPPAPADPGLAALPADDIEAVDRSGPRRSAPVREARSAGEPLTEFPDFRTAESTYPELVDLESDRVLMRRYYPPELQSRGIGGTVGLLLWVDSAGAVDNVQLARTSGVPALDRAALQAAPSLRFHPTTRNGQPVGTWVEFDLSFEPLEGDAPLPEVLPVADPTPGSVEWELDRDWTEPSFVPAPIRLEAQQLLRAALGQTEQELEKRFGPLEGLLQGDPPAGASPLQWRSEVSEALDRAMVRDPDNPAPYLALARIRRKQGMRDDARLLLGTGLDRAREGVRPVSDRMAAELAYEYGRALKEEWLAWRDLGRLPVDALDGRACPRRAGPSGDVDAEILIAWNYLCSGELGRAFGEAFEPVVGGAGELDAMRRSLRDAVRVFPSHVGANVELLLALADEGAWTQLFNQAQRFARASNGHPYARLMSGLALHRLARAEEAVFELRQGLEGLDEEVRGSFGDVRVLDATWTGDDARGFWASLDPLMSTDVNERELEHLARATYAFLRFGGLQGDAARVWLRYGRPLTVRAVGSVGGLRTEFWDYGEGPDVTFTRPSRAEEYTLTSEARAYLEDLARVFPHGMGRGAPSRTVGELPAQVGRFRALREGWVELELALAIPEALRAGAAPGDSLDLGLFLVGEGDAVLGEVRDRVGVRDGVVRWALPAAPEVDRLVVELYNPRNHQAAGRDLPLRDQTSPAGRISDMMLIDGAAEAEIPFRRGDVYALPLARGDRLDGDRLGLAFEVYEIEAGGAPYRMRVELVRQGLDGAVAIPFRPSYQTAFRTGWTREPASATMVEAGLATGPIVRGDRALEVLTLDLTGVPPGSYTLRTVLEFPGGGEVVRERADLRRRAADRGDDEAGDGPGSAPDGFERD